MTPDKTNMPGPDAALPGRDDPVPVTEPHVINGRDLTPPYPDNTEQVLFGIGCFWGGERKFWLMDGVWVTAVGYAGGYTPNPTYEEVCTGKTGHAEVIRVVYDPKRIPFHQLLKEFWEMHDPTQGMRQGSDVGTQYRSAIFCYTGEQLALAEASAKDYAAALEAVGFPGITTEIREAPEFYFAETEHQQYLARNPFGSCEVGGTGVPCTITRSA